MAFTDKLPSEIKLEDIVLIERENYTYWATLDEIINFISGPSGLLGGLNSLANVQMTFPSKVVEPNKNTLLAGIPFNININTGEWNNITQTFTAVKEADYLITGTLSYQPASWQGQGTKLLVFLSGSVNDVIGWSHAPNNNVSDYVGITISGLVRLKVGEYFQFNTFQNSGKNKTIDPTITSSINIRELKS